MTTNPDPAAAGRAVDLTPEDALGWLDELAERGGADYGELSLDWHELSLFSRAVDSLRAALADRADSLAATNAAWRTALAGHRFGSTISRTSHEFTGYIPRCSCGAQLAGVETLDEVWPVYVAHVEAEAARLLAGEEGQ